MKTKRYVIRINCPCYEDIEVFAKTNKEAIDMAERRFRCPADDAEFGEILEEELGSHNGHSTK